jgi:hypothetical protein
MGQDPSYQADMWLQRFRHKIINLLLGSVSVLGALGILINMYQELQSGSRTISFISTYYLGAYIGVLILFFAKRISDRWRAIGFLLLVYIFALFAFYTGWLGGSGRIYLLPWIVLTAILIGPHEGVVSALVSLATYAVFGIAYRQGWLVYNLAPRFAESTIIWVEGIGFAMAVGMISIGLWFFRQGLDAATQAIEETNQARSLLTERASELDVANQLLAERSQKLEGANAELESQNWYNTGRSLLYEAMRETQDISFLADKVLMELCKLLGFPVGALFILENDSLTRVGKYAFPADATLANRFKLGQGLVGQAALEKRVILVQDMPSDSLKISSGLGQVPATSLLIVPLIYDEQVIGVMEFGLLRDEVEAQKDFLASVSESIAIAFNTAQNRSRIDHLLAETQRQAKELKDQEEELRAANKELQQQAKILRSENFQA